MPKQLEEAQTYTDLMQQHGFSVPSGDDNQANYRRMEDIAALIGKWRRTKGLPIQPCPACGQRKSGCWSSPDHMEQLCVNQPSSVDFGEEDGEYGPD